MMRELLKEKFGDCKFKDVSDCNGSYENINETAFYVFDPLPEDNRPVRIVKNTEDYQLTVTNENNTEICLVKTDKCLFTNDVSKCDCLLFSNNKFYLVEIKSSSKGTRKNKRHDAVVQLGNTIERLSNNGVTLKDFEAKAIICFKHENEYPVQASRNSKRAIFLEKYKVSLDEGNKIEF